MQKERQVRYRLNEDHVELTFRYGETVAAASVIITVSRKTGKTTLGSIRYQSPWLSSYAPTEVSPDNPELHNLLWKELVLAYRKGVEEEGRQVKLEKAFTESL